VPETEEGGNSGGQDANRADADGQVVAVREGLGGGVSVGGAEGLSDRANARTGDVLGLPGRGGPG
jgi:hypothetical protein